MTRESPLPFPLLPFLSPYPHPPAITQAHTSHSAPSIGITGAPT
jgi:hypothetical protein